jgi:ribosomal protein L11 methyltransferase
MLGRPNGTAERRWLLLSVQAPPHGEELLLVDALRRLGARLVEREGERFVAHLPHTDDPETLLGEAEAAVRASTRLRDPGLSWRWGTQAELAERWLRDVQPRRVTGRIVVAVDGTEPEALSGDLVVRLQPGFGFGTAGHPTTRLCLGFLDGLVQRGDRIADVGTGSGILAIAAALLGAARVLAFEADPLACALARENAAGSGVGGRVEVRHHEVGPGGQIGSATFDGVVANLEASMLLPRLAGLAEATAPGGWEILSGATRSERADLLHAAEDAGLTLGDEAVEDGWWGGIFRRSGGG